MQAPEKPTMCKALEKVTNEEWDNTRAEISKIKTQLARWGGGLTALMAIMGVIGGMLYSSTQKMAATVDNNKDFATRSEERDKGFSRTLEVLTITLERLAKKDDELKDELDLRTKNRYTEEEAKANRLEDRAWVREQRESDRQINEINRLQLQKMIEQLGKDLEIIKKTVP